MDIIPQSKLGHAQLVLQSLPQAIARAGEERNVDDLDGIVEIIDNHLAIGDDWKDSREGMPCAIALVYCRNVAVMLANAIRRTRGIRGRKA